MLKCSYLLLFGLITISAVSAFNCSSPVPSITCTCNNKGRKVSCINTEADNDTSFAVVNNILQSSNISVVSVRIESPQLHIGAMILFPNASLVGLEIVNSDLTELHELSLSNLRELKRLDLSNNSLTSIPRSSLHHLSALERLTLSHNKIQHIYEEDLQNFSKLRYLYLDNNKISVIDEGSFAALEMCTLLHLQNNLLLSLNRSIFEGLKTLIVLDISSNRISSLPRDLLDHVPKLHSLNASNNFFTSLKSIQFRSPTLSVLSLVNSSTKGPLERGILEGLPMLKTLSLGHNSFGNILPYSFAHMWNLNELKLDSCDLVSLDDNAFYNLTSLTRLTLRNNLLKKLSCFHTSFLDSLEKINLENNKLETIEKGTFYYSHSLADINLTGNKLLCNCELASFSEFMRNRSLHLNNVECTDGSTLDKIDFGKMNCIDNADVCTKVEREASAVPDTSSNKEFTITIIEITQIDDTLGIKYFINKSSNFSESGYSCSIYHEHLDKGGFQKSDLCFFTIGKEEHINLAISEGKGNYNVCIGILYNETIYFSECQLADYEPVETTEAQSTSDVSETITANATTTSVTTVSLSTEKATMSTTSTAKATTAAAFIHETFTASLAEIYTAKTSKETIESSELPTVNTSAGTTTKFPTSFETTTASVSVITTQLPTYFENATSGMRPVKPSFNAVSVKFFSLHKNAKGQLSLSWNVTLEDPQVACYLRLSVLPYNQPEQHWQRECISGTLFLGEMENTISYQVCVEMYLEKKFVERNCTEFSSVFPESAASSESTWQSSKLPMAAFIALVILAVIILILIIVVLIKLVYLRRNKTNVYYVAKEEVNSHEEITKRSSKLYSVSSVEDDKV